MLNTSIYNATDVGTEPIDSSRRNCAAIDPAFLISLSPCKYELMFFAVSAFEGTESQHHVGLEVGYNGYFLSS